MTRSHLYRRAAIAALATILSLSPCITSSVVAEETSEKSGALIRYRLFRVRETALRQQNERVLFPALTASRKLGKNWNAVSDKDKLRLIDKLETELGLAPVNSLPDGVLERDVAFAVPRREFLGVPYPKLDGVDPKYLSLDIYTPKDDRQHPVILWLHGGAMKGGDKAHPVIAAIKSDYFVSRGFVFVSANYRLAPKHKYPAQAHDAAAAISFTHDNVHRYGGDPDQLFLIGNSAGGQLAGIVSTNERYLSQHKKSLEIITGAVILDIGSFDIPSILDQLGKNAPEMYHYTFRPNRADWIDASPLYHVKAGKKVPPMLLIYVDGRTHHERENKRFAARMKQFGYQATIYAAKNKTHITLAAELATSHDAPTEVVMKFFTDLRASHTKR